MLSQSRRATPAGVQTGKARVWPGAAQLETRAAALSSKLEQLIARRAGHMNELTTVDFHGATLIALRGEDEASTLVAMKPIVEGMGIRWQAQHAKLLAHPVYGKGIKNILIPSSGGPQEVTALPSALLAGHDPGHLRSASVTEAWALPPRHLAAAGLVAEAPEGEPYRVPHTILLPAWRGLIALPKQRMA